MFGGTNITLSADAYLGLDTAKQNNPWDELRQSWKESWSKGEEMNHVACAISVTALGAHRGDINVCLLCMTNTAFRGLRLPPQMLYSIDMYDASNNFVKKTDYGKEIGCLISQNIVTNWFFNIPKNMRPSAFFLVKQYSWESVTSYDKYEPEKNNNLNLFRIFQLNKSGEYTIHLRMRLVQTAFVDKAQTSPRKNIFEGQSWNYRKCVFLLDTWLPEVVVNVSLNKRDFP